MSTRRNIAALAAGVGLVTALAACAAEQPSETSNEVSDIVNYQGTDREEYLYNCAKQEGKMVYYTSLSAAETVLKTGFEAKYPGVTLEPIRDSAVAQRLIKEEEAGRHIFDVLGDVYGTLPRTDEFFVEFYTPNRERLQPELNDPYFVGTGGFIQGFAYNPNLVSESEAPTKWEDLLDPKWKGEVLSSDDPTAPITAALIAKSKGDDFLQKLADQVQVQAGVTSGGVADLLAAGQAKLAINISTTNIAKLAGSPFVWVPMDPMMAWYQVESISKSAPHPCAAALWVDWLLDDREGGGEPLHSQFGRSSPLQGKPMLSVEVPGADPENWNLQYVTDPTLWEGYESFTDFHDEWTRTFEELFKR